VKTYVFRVVVEPDEDRWVAYSPSLKSQGGATWGYTQNEALENIRQVLQITVASMVEHGESIPEDPDTDVQVFGEPQVAITV
jgi:predicted RNase H-like HicB family nuclease